MSEIVFQITEDDTDGGFIARALGHSIITEADTWEQLRINVREAVLCHFDAGQVPAVTVGAPVSDPARFKKTHRRAGSETGDPFQHGQIFTLNSPPVLSDCTKPASNCGISSKSFRLTTSTGECM